MRNKGQKKTPSEEGVRFRLRGSESESETEAVTRLSDGGKTSTK